MPVEKKYTLEEVKEIVNSILGKTFGELNSYKARIESFNKGFFGHVLEEDVFHYGKNSKSSPDLENVGIELKMTPYKINKDGTLSAKERLVLNIINYMDEYKHSFYDSHFWYKNKLIQIVWYLYEEGKPKRDFRITDELLFTFPEDDLPIIIQDWNSIINKIKDGKAHELSEADTMYLGACTKGVNSSSLRKQPFSNILAKQRAFCLKTSYMSELVRTHIGGKKLVKITTNSEMNKMTFEDFVHSKVEKFVGKTQQELMNMFGIITKPKNLNEIIICKMFGIKSDLKKTDEFVKANIVPRTIRVQYNGTIKESLPFPAFEYTRIVKENWETSDLRTNLLSTKYLFFIFRERKGEYIFKGSKLWNIPLNILDTNVKAVWEKTREIINDGKIVAYVNDKGVRKTNFPGMKDSFVCHVRPHARDASDCFPLPVVDKETGLNEYTKHSFWINATYLAKIINGDKK